MQLSEFEFDVVHRARITHQASEALSRLLTSGEGNTSLEDDLPPFTIDTILNLGDTYICGIDTTKDDSILLDNNDTGVLLDASPVESELVMEQAQETY